MIIGSILIYTDIISNYQFIFIDTFFSKSIFYLMSLKVILDLLLASISNIIQGWLIIKVVFLAKRHVERAQAGPLRQHWRVDPVALAPHLYHLQPRVLDCLQACLKTVPILELVKVRRRARVCIVYDKMYDKRVRSCCVVR